MFRVAGVWPLKDGAAALAALAAAPPVDRFAGVPLHAPVLIVPHVFEPALCASLIDYYRREGGDVSGVARDVAGKTENVDVPDKKRRSDCTIADPALRDETTRRMAVRLFPQIEKAFYYKVTRVERYIVACYDAATGGYFKMHRDTTSAATAHRAFAVTMNLNADSFTGDDLCFPEYGTRTYRAPTGGAVVFSCHLLHEAMPVTRGQRFAFLPFLYNEEGEAIRQRTSLLAGSSVKRQA